MLKELILYCNGEKFSFSIHEILSLSLDMLKKLEASTCRELEESSSHLFRPGLTPAVLEQLKRNNFHLDVQGSTWANPSIFSGRSNSSLKSDLKPIDWFFAATQIDKRYSRFYKIGGRLIKCQQDNFYMIDYGRIELHKNMEKRAQHLISEKMIQSLAPMLVKEDPQTKQLSLERKYLMPLIIILVLTVIMNICLTFEKRYSGFSGPEGPSYRDLNKGIKEQISLLMEKLPLDVKQLLNNLGEERFKEMIEREVIPNEMRKILNGSQDSNFEAIPALIATIFLAETKRNRLAFLTNLMLLDFMEGDVKYGRKAKVSICKGYKHYTWEAYKHYTWEKILWNPLTIDPSKEKTTTLKKVDGYLGNKLKKGILPYHLKVLPSNLSQLKKVKYIELVYHPLLFSHHLMEPDKLYLYIYKESSLYFQTTKVLQLVDKNILEEESFNKIIGALLTKKPLGLKESIAISNVAIKKKLTDTNENVIYLYIENNCLYFDIVKNGIVVLKKETIIPDQLALKQLDLNRIKTFLLSGNPKVTQLCKLELSKISEIISEIISQKGYSLMFYSSEEKGIYSLDEWGGKSSMASFKSVNNLKNNPYELSFPLIKQRQKEGTILIRWLYEAIKKYFPRYNPELGWVDDPLTDNEHHKVSPLLKLNSEFKGIKHGRYNKSIGKQNHLRILQMRRHLLCAIIEPLLMQRMNTFAFFKEDAFFKAKYYAHKNLDNLETHRRINNVLDSIAGLPNGKIKIQAEKELVENVMDELFKGDLIGLRIATTNLDDIERNLGLKGADKKNFNAFDWLPSDERHLLAVQHPNFRIGSASSEGHNCLIDSLSQFFINYNEQYKYNKGEICELIRNRLIEKGLTSKFAFLSTHEHGKPILGLIKEIGFSINPDNYTIETYWTHGGRLQPTEITGNGDYFLRLWNSGIHYEPIFVGGSTPEPH